MTASKMIPPGAFFKDASFDFEARIALGATAAGIGDAGLVFATLDSVVDGDSQSWFDAWYATAARLADQGAAAAAVGHQRSAGWAYLAAAEYYARAMGAIDGLADQSGLLPTFAEHRRCWEAVVDNSAGRYVRVSIPYPGPAGSGVTSLPGYLLRPDASGSPRPTLVMTNGSDGSLPGLIGYGAAEALARGWNAFLYDGPGQQSLLFEHDVPFRPDWEAVLTPVIDTLSSRDDVDASALVGYGISQAGYWLPRALAFEHRLVAAVADPGVVDVSTSWTANLPAEMIGLLDSNQKDVFNGYLNQVGDDPAMAREFAFRARPYAVDDPFELFKEVQKYQLRDVVEKISTPLLITDPQDEQFWPGQPTELFTLLPGAKDIIEFTRADGANLHCQPMGRELTHQRMFDWLTDRLAERKK